MTARRYPAIGGAEDFLRAKKAYNVENSVWPSENVIIDRLLSARAEMSLVYTELERKITAPRVRGEFLRRLVSLAAFGNPARCKSIRDQVDRAERLNNEIAEKARELAELVRQREDSCQDVRLPYDYHPLELIERAAQQSGDIHKAALFNSWVKKDLSVLRREFDLKYWPSTDELLDTLAAIQQETPPEPRDSLMANAISMRSHSTGDFIRAILTEIDEMSDKGRESLFRLPVGFSLTDEAISRFATVALRLDPALTSGSVKQHRNRFRKDADAAVQFG